LIRLLRNIALYLLAACLSAAGLLAGPARGQMSIARIQISQVDASAFPEVRLRAILRDGNTNPVSLTDARQSLELVETILGESRLVSQGDSYTISDVRAGVQVLFVVDIGQGINVSTLTGQSRLEDMKDILDALLSSLENGDSAGLMVVRGAEVRFLQPLTAELELLPQAMLSLPVDANGPSDSPQALEDALDELGGDALHGSLVQTVVFLSANIQQGSQRLPVISNTALRRDKVFIHTILVRKEEADLNQDFAAPLKALAANTGGSYIHYTEPGSITPLQAWLSGQRQQTAFSYRTERSDSAPRTLELRTRSSGVSLVSDSASYQVSPQPPRVIIEQPATNSEIRRLPAPGQTDPAQAEPLTALVTARVEWPDGYPRAITQAQLWVADLLTGPPLPNPGQEIRFTWDLTPYRTPGSLAVRLQVQVQDELGMQSLSDPAVIRLSLDLPAAASPTLPPASPVQATPAPLPPQPGGDDCSGLSGAQSAACRLVSLSLATWISILSLGVAALALALAYYYRDRLGKAGDSALDIMRQTFSRLATPASAELSATLEVLRGDDSLYGKRIPLYARTATPAGRSPQEAELVFDMYNDHSMVSRRHCEFREENGNFYVRDLGSTHGTFVNGMRLPEGGRGQALRDGDQIELGPVDRGGVLLRFRQSRPGAGRPPSKEEDNPYATRPGRPV
jgi:hypothetical protein